MQFSNNRNLINDLTLLVNAASKSSLTYKQISHYATIKAYSNDQLTEFIKLNQKEHLITQAVETENLWRGKDTVNEVLIKLLPSECKSIELESFLSAVISSPVSVSGTSSPTIDTDHNTVYNVRIKVNGFEILMCLILEDDCGTVLNRKEFIVLESGLEIFKQRQYQSFSKFEWAIFLNKIRECIQNYVLDRGELKISDCKRLPPNS